MRTLAVTVSGWGRGMSSPSTTSPRQLCRPAPRRLGRRRAPHRARDQEPAPLRSSSPPSGLQRRYGRQITEDGGTFERLVSTIIRQVGDLRRMIDEFSSFARMPKPQFRRENLLDIARQALFLHEVSAPHAIGFSLDAPDTPVEMVCDRRQIGQAFTKRRQECQSEAVEARVGEERRGPGRDDDTPVRRTAVHRACRRRHRPARRARAADRTLYDDPRARHRPRPRHRPSHRRGASRRDRLRRSPGRRLDRAPRFDMAALDQMAEAPPAEEYVPELAAEPINVRSG